MKEGNCPMCKSNDVYMTENENTLHGGSVEGLSFEAGEGRASSLYTSDTYVCLNCGYTAMIAKIASAGFPGLSLLKNAKGWKKAG